MCKFGNHWLILTVWYIFAFSYGQSSIYGWNNEMRTRVFQWAALAANVQVGVETESETAVSHPSERLWAQRREAYWNPPGERSNFKVIEMDLRRRGTEKVRNKPLPFPPVPAPLQHVASCLLNKQVKRWERKGQWLVAHFLEKDAGIGWRRLSIHQILTQQVPLHSTLCFSDKVSILVPSLLREQSFWDSPRWLSPKRHSFAF